ncbi:amino acid transporter AVT1D-like isoform X2 [Penaeus monodon]|uniref:amino acid transporter AVT1D-like isoform X2 n=1 Tax=Penaeus monodon TaxID=6687 RepID=UPI0018A73A77|nr:amino acid transporter AVT1D-like isoform X2 [Penaeus monodon]
MSVSKKSISSISGSISEKGASLSITGVEEDVKAGKKGLSTGMTSFFLVAQMAGAGFLALPRALADTGWFGIAMMTIFCVSVAFSGTRLGRCWTILEERYPEYSQPVRQPYMEIAYRSMGLAGRRAALASVVINLYGSTTVFIILISQMISSRESVLSLCELVLIVGFLIIPLTWLGTPKDFWQASVLAVVSTVVACVVIIVQILLEAPNLPEPVFDNPTVSSFSLGFGAILFSFGGSAVFPTIQNDMQDRTQFWKSVVVGFAVILSLYVPVASVGYSILGQDVESNILLSVPKGVAVNIAIILEIINLLSTFIISFNPVAQSLEDILNVPNKFCLKRVLLRSSMVMLQMLICLAVPDFGLILNLIGGSCITLCTFVFPPIMYIRLMDMEGEPSWPKRKLPLWERVYLIEILIVGVVGGICSTVSAVIAILDPAGFQKNCFVNFFDLF